MNNIFRKELILWKLREKVDYDFFKTTHDYWNSTIKELPYSLIIDGTTKQIFISKNDNLGYGWYMKISINGINYRDISEYIKMKYWTFDSYAFSFYFNPLNEENF